MNPVTMSKILDAGIIVFVAAFAGLLIPSNIVGIATAQNGYDEYEDDEYYPQQDNSYYQDNQRGYGYSDRDYQTGSGYSDRDYQTGYGNYEKDHYAKPGKLTVIKELFQCFNPTTGGSVNSQTPQTCTEFIQTPQPGHPATSTLVPPTSPLYKDCSDPQVECRYSTEDFVIDVINGQKITSDPDGVVVKLSDKQYFVEEDDIRTDYAVEKSCKNSGYDQGGVVGFPGALQQTGVCIIYEGDCEGELKPGDNKVCTVKNYIPVATVRNGG